MSKIAQRCFPLWPWTQFYPRQHFYDPMLITFIKSLVEAETPLLGMVRTARLGVTWQDMAVKWNLWGTWVRGWPTPKLPCLRMKKTVEVVVRCT